MQIRLFGKAGQSMLLTLALGAVSARGNVNVVQNGGPGATNWPGSPIISTVADPSTLTVGESFNNPNTSIGQTFTVTTTNYTLTNIEIYAQGGSGTGAGTNITLNLFDLGSQTAPNPSQYTASIVGGNLLGGGAGLTINYNSQVNGTLEFDFTGADQATLQAGHMYVFELAGVSGTTPIFWQRAVSDTYPGGAAYRNQSWINGNSARDFALAVYGIVTTNGSAPPPVLCTVDWNDVRQRIDGFGASSAFRTDDWTSAQADMFFTTNSGTGLSKNGTNFSYNGIGLSILRNKIAITGNAASNELSFMQMAQARGAIVWSAPWTPPTIYKTVADPNSGFIAGNPANYQGYASFLANYVVQTKNAGVNLYALSVQNEPDETNLSYESCGWTSQNFHDFIPYLSSALAASNVGSVKILLPEQFQWRMDLATNAMFDGTTSNLVGILAAHNYDNSDFPAAAITAFGTPPPKPLWETETSSFDAFDGSITNGVFWAGRIHLHLTIAQANAWHFWWLISLNPDNEGLTDTNNVPAKRMYALGNFSRFVRPNYYRIGTTNGGSPLISAYADTNSGNFAIVAVNSSSLSVTQAFSLNNFATVSSVTPWVTSATQSLANQPAVTVSNAAFSYVLPPVSVVTFAGQAAVPAPPTLTVAQSGNSVILSWPTNSAGFALEYSTDLSSGVWNPVAGMPSVTGNLNTWTNGATNPISFYRLRK